MNRHRITPKVERAGGGEFGGGKRDVTKYTSLAPKPSVSSAYVHVREARCPDKWSISVMSHFPSSDSLWRRPARGYELGVIVRTGASTTAEAFRFDLAERQPTA